MNDTPSIAWLGLDATPKIACSVNSMIMARSQILELRYPTQQLIQRIKDIPAPTSADARRIQPRRWISQLLKTACPTIVVCDARRNRLISQDHHKHDQRDAFALARLLRLNEFKPVWQPPRINASSSNASPRLMKTPSSARPAQAPTQIPLPTLGALPAGASVYSQARPVAWLKQLPYDPLRAQALLLYELLDQALAGQAQFRRLMCQTGRQFPEIQR